MRLGGFVIHGDAAATLGPCLESLAAVSDELVAVDSGSRDGSAELVRASGARRVEHAWCGYGAARAAAVAALPATCDYVFFLDSDERLLPEAVEALRRWKAGSPSAPYGRLAVRDWADLPGRRFLFRTERHVRAVRRDHARWTPGMIVHEALPRGPAVEDLPAVIEHRFADGSEGRSVRQERYALLWAVRARVEGWRRKPASLQRLAHTLRNGVLKGALFRGGWPGLALAWSVARYHQRKHAHLAALERGEHAELVEALREGRLGELLERVAAIASRD